MNPEIESYLNGEMTEEERMRFEEKMRQDAVLFAQVQTQRAFLGDLKNQMKREKLKAILAEAPQDRSLRGRRGKLGGLFLLLVAFLVFLWLRRGEEQNRKAIDPPGHTPVLADTIRNLERTPAWEENVQPATEMDAPATHQPIAQGPTTTQSPAMSSVRGATSGDIAWDSLFASVLQTGSQVWLPSLAERFPKLVHLLEAQKNTDAYVQIRLQEENEPPNDTLLFLKGYCLLALGEGREALTTFRSLGPSTPWKQDIAWYSALALFLAGEQEEALIRAKAIAEDQNHRYQHDARQVVLSLE